MKTKVFTNLILVIGLLFTLAFACNDDTRSGESTSTENQDEETLDQPENQSVQGPRLGKYDILSRGDIKYPPIRIGHFELLRGGKYKFYDNGGNFKSEGKYRFEPATSTVNWLSGTFKDDGWGDSAFKVGKTGEHSIRLKGTTYAYNSQ